MIRDRPKEYGYVSGAKLGHPSLVLNCSSFSGFRAYKTHKILTWSFLASSMSNNYKLTQKRMFGTFGGKTKSF